MHALVRWLFLRGWRSLLLSSPLLLLLLWVLGEQEEGKGVGRGRGILQALPRDGPSTHIESSWESGATSEGGFLAVEGILSDPRTTGEPPYRPIETLSPSEKDQEQEEQQKQSEVRQPEGQEERKGHEKETDKIETDKIETDKPLVPQKSKKLQLVIPQKPQKPQKIQKPHLAPRVKGDLVAAARARNDSLTDFQSVMTYNSHFSPHVTRDLYTPGYSRENRDACRPDMKVSVVILVISAPEHRDRRDAIRKSWGRHRDKVVFSFLVGSSPGPLGASLEQEAAEHGDLVLARLEDRYENLGLKTIAALDWVATNCPAAEYLLKVDDDMFVQVSRLLELVEELVKEDGDQKLIVGNISRGWKPVRNPKSKYYISPAQYREETYPDFATGPSYLVSKRAVEGMVEAALDMLYIHLEDVFLTGVVAESLGVERRNVEQFKNNAVRVPARFMGCTLLHTITIHKVGPEEQSELHALASQPECGKGNKRPKPLSKGDWKKALARRRGEQKYLQSIAEKNKV